MKKTIMGLFLFFGLTANADSSYDLIRISGEGQTQVKPEYVMLSITVYSRAKQAQEAQMQNAKDMTKLSQVLKQDFKIDAKDIQTTAFQVTPEYAFVNNKSIYKGMNVNHMLTVKYRKTDDVGNLLDRLTENKSQEGTGVRVDSLSFGSDQIRALQNTVLEMAVNDAKARAEVLAKAAGRKIKSVRRISDSGVQSAHPEGARMMKMSMAEDAGGTAVSPGQLNVTANVQVEFDLQ